MVNANALGFLPGNDAALNAEALQAAVDLGGEISVEAAGVYDLSETVWIGDDTALLFAAGVQIRRQPSRTGRNGNAFINKGAASHTRNRNIRLIGLHIDCNGVESADFGVDSTVLVGLRAHVAMIYVQDLVVEDFACTGLLKKDYAIQISAFENIRLENLYITGEKDGVHLGWGRGFVIRHGRFCTFDDPIALNAFDYSVSNPHVGWIEDGLIEDCTDLPADSTTGFFCRILGGAWCDWFPGMQVQHSDTVCRDGRVYRVVMQPDGTIYTSDTPPCHESGVQTYDGIHWVCVRNEPVYDCGCRNIVLRDIRLQKKRGTAVGISLNRDAYAQSCYPHSKPVPQAGITLEKIRIENGVVNLIGSNYPTGDITVADTDLKEAKLCFRAEEIAGIGYPEAHVTLRNVIRKEDSIYSDGKHPVFVTEVR